MGSGRKQEELQPCEDGGRIYGAVCGQEIRLGSSSGTAGEPPQPLPPSLLGSSGHLSEESRGRAEMFTTPQMPILVSASSCTLARPAGAQWSPRRRRCCCCCCCRWRPPVPSSTAGGWICARVTRPAEALEEWTRPFPPRPERVAACSP